MKNLIFGLLFIFSSKISFRIEAKKHINIFSDFTEIKKYCVKKTKENNEFVLETGDYIFFNAKKFSIEYNKFTRKLKYEE